MAEKLTKQQQSVVENRGGNLLVSAAAGSGKTKVLVERLMSYLTDPVAPANIDDFLIITFTKAAAAELRGKIAARLSQQIARDSKNRHLRQQLSRLYLAKITTVHSFCSDIIKQYAYQLDISGDFRMGDDQEFAVMQEDLLNSLMERVYTEDGISEDVFTFLDEQGIRRNSDIVSDTVRDLYQASRCHLDPDGWLSWCGEIMDVDQDSDMSQTIWGKYLIDGLHGYLSMQAEAFENCQKAAAEAGYDKVAANLGDTAVQLRRICTLRTWDEIHQAHKITYDNLSFPRKDVDPVLKEKIKMVRDSGKKKIAARLALFSVTSEQALSDLKKTAPSVRGLVSLVRCYGEAYQAEKRKRRLLDYNDLEQITLDLFRGKRRDRITNAAKEVALRFREIMVDEYQDTNAVQDAIFYALTESRHNCFMVGDVKQAIYQFRLADPGIFLEKYRAYLPAEEAKAGQGRKIILSNNFRSSGGVISGVNDVFRLCMAPDVGGLYYDENEALVEGLPHTDIGEPEVSLHTIQVNGGDTYGEEAEYVADRIATLLDGTHMVRDGEELRPMRPSDIVILLRSPNSSAGIYQYAIEQRGYRCDTGQRGDLFQREEVSAICAILRVISNPLQDIPLIAALTSRAYCFTADELAMIRGRNKKVPFYESMRQSGDEKARQFIESIQVLREDAKYLGLFELVERILNDTRLDSIYGAMPDGEERLGNIRSFCQFVANFEAGGQKDLERFLEHLDGAIKSGLKVESSGPADAIHICSIHSSKGLEYPVVFLCALSKGFNTEDNKKQIQSNVKLGIGMLCVDVENRYGYPTIARRAISAKRTADLISEELRLLYVAMTRARDRLEMVYASKALSKNLTYLSTMLDLAPRELISRDVDCAGDWVLMTAMQKTEAGGLFAVSARPEHVSSQPIPWAINVIQGQADSAVYSHQLEETQTLDPETVQRIRNSLDFQYRHEQAIRVPSKLTATQLKGRQKDAESAEYAFHRPMVPGSWRKPTFAEGELTPTDRGTAIHGILERICYSSCGDAESVAAQLREMLRRGEITQQQYDSASPEQIASFFRSPLGVKVRESQNVLREYKFSLLMDSGAFYPGTEGEKVLFQGVVDCAILEPDGITVIDFKTDRVTEKTLMDVSERYRLQVEAYALALERIFQMPVRAKYLYFFHISKEVLL